MAVDRTLGDYKATCQFLQLYTSVLFRTIESQPAVLQPVPGSHGLWLMLFRSLKPLLKIDRHAEGAFGA